MRCTRCQGLLVNPYGTRYCINCGNRPDTVIVARKCAYTDCLVYPDHGDLCGHHRAIALTKSVSSRAAASRRGQYQ
jgi:hypothetical protein